MSRRRYLDWNASAPLRPEARAAMAAALDTVGNPSSVHAEGRAAKAMVEHARGQVAALIGCEAEEVIFTSGATEAANTVIAGADWGRIAVSGIEHDAVYAAALARRPDAAVLGATPQGEIELGEIALRDSALEEIAQNDDAARAVADGGRGPALLCLQAANSETGVHQRLEERAAGAARLAATLCDLTQLAARPATPPTPEGRHDPGAMRTTRDLIAADVFSHGVLSAHKLGGPQGVGALIQRRPAGRTGSGGATPELRRLLIGGGQELGRRSGTENVAAIAGFGAAATAAQEDLARGVWAQVAALRDRLEARLRAAAPELVVFGEGAWRLANTSNMAVPGWRGETQVIQLDLAGFAISAGSACSSGKVTASRVLRAMGCDEALAGSAIRVSLGPTTTAAEVDAFADAWTTAYRRWSSKRR